MTEMPGGADFEAYNRFVHGVRPVRVWLRSANVRADRYPGGAVEVAVGQMSASWESQEKGFMVVAPLWVLGTAGKSKGTLRIELELVVEYETSEAMTNEFFMLFVQGGNLQLNAWPFLRESVAGLMTRTGWPPLVLPAFLRSEQKPKDEASKALPKSSPARVAEGGRRKKPGPK